MSVHVYKTSGGLFSIVKDDTAYNTFDNLSSVLLIDNYILTHAGNEFIQGVPVDDIYLTALRTADSYDESIFNAAKLLYPNLETEVMRGVTTSATNFSFAINNGYDVMVEAYIRSGNQPSWLLFDTQRIRKGSEYFERRLDNPLGRFYGPSATPIYIALGLIVLNSEGTLGRVISIGPGGDNTKITINANLSLTSSQLSFINTMIGEVKPYYPTTDPFGPDGPSEPSGGGGDFNGTSDPNPIPSDPTISATDTGFMTVFATDLSGIQALSASLWADIFPQIGSGGALEGTVQALKNIVASPYDAILGCHIVPVNVPRGTAKNVKLYGVLPSTVTMNVASSQWVHKDCGYLDMIPYDKSYLDYAPYSKVTSLYLPYVGVVSVDMDIIMGKRVGVYYKIDIVSGQCIAYVTVDGDVYFQYQGFCAVPLPVTSIDWSNTVAAGLGLVGSVASIVGSAVGGGLGGGGSAGALAGAVKGTMGEAGSMAQNVMNSKPDIKAGGGVGGSAALLGCKTPFLIVERPRKSTPGIGKLFQNHWTGYPSNIAARLGDLTGYTEVSRIFVNRTNATADEKREIEQLLTEGVYL